MPEDLFTGNRFYSLWPHQAHPNHFLENMLENINIWLIYIPSMARYFHVSRRVFQGFDP